MSYHIRYYDEDGLPFQYPPLILYRIEYAKIYSEINSNYLKYENEPIAVHLSYGVDGTMYIYFFENHGFNQYNIFARFED